MFLIVLIWLVKVNWLTDNDWLIDWFWWRMLLKNLANDDSNPSKQNDSVILWSEAKPDNVTICFWTRVSFCFCHSYEYNHERKCLRDHIATCLTSNMAPYVKPVTSLLLHQIYHCGDLEYQPSPLNKYILSLIKCKQEAFMDTEFCWRYFRGRLNANRSDPLLCRWDLHLEIYLLLSARSICFVCLSSVCRMPQS